MTITLFRRRAAYKHVYLPPNQRTGFRGFKFSFSFSNLLLLIIFSLAFYSLISPLEEIIFRPKKIQASSNSHPEVEIKKISDSLKAVEAKPNLPRGTFASVNLDSVDLSVFPLERRWPVRGRLTTFYSSYHPAIDIATTWGTPVQAYSSGIVKSTSSKGSFGKHIVIAHSGGVETLYAHLSSIKVVAGQEVNPSTLIGAIGSTGRSTGPHLHFQVTQSGLTVNPLKVLS